MDDPISRGLPFELADIWRRSAFQVKEEPDSLFGPLDSSFPPLELNHAERKAYENELLIPPLLDANGSFNAHDLEPLESEVASPATGLWDTGQPAPDDHASVWDFDLQLNEPLKGPRLHTWEAFEKKDVPNAERTAYLSEAGPRAFDAALVNRQGRSNGVLPRDVMLRALCNLALGRASVFFQWDESKAAFTRTLPDVPTTGYSPSSCNSYIQRLTEHATLYRSLRAFITYRTRRETPPSLVAFNGCAGGILDALEEHITQHLTGTRSILQLQTLVDRPIEVVDVLKRLRHSISAAKSDEEVISGLSNCVHELVSANNSLAAILRSILERTSATWLEKLAVDIGLSDDAHALTEEGDRAEEDSANLYIAADQAQVEHLHDFMASEDRAMIQGAKTSLRILQKSDSHQSMRDEEAEDLFRSVLHYDLRNNDPNTQRSALAARSGAERQWTPDNIPEPAAWVDGVQMEHMDREMSNLPQTFERADDILHSATLAYCETTEPPTNLAALLTFDLSPLDRIRPALSAQHVHLNRTLLRQLFAKDLLDHLRLQHDYHLFGSGEFVTRLSTALFSAETQSAERKRGVVPTGEAMGLKLGARQEQRWPPASSELRLTLMDVLVDTYKIDHANRLRDKGRKELPGGLSFSIRELPEEEIERVLDPSSIYALDFLRLSYVAPTPLDAVLTPKAMGVYDSVLRLLLRLLRLLHVTSSLSRAVSSRHHLQDDYDDSSSGSRVTFALRARNFVTVLMSHMMDVGINAPWYCFMRSLADVQSSLANGSVQAIVSIDALQRMHTECLETIRGRLFLRRRQEKLRVAVENVLSRTLEAAAAMGDNGIGNERAACDAFDDAMGELLKLLRSAVDKPPSIRTKTKIMNDGDDDDNEMTRVLLTRLDWNGFYQSEGVAADRADDA